MKQRAEHIILALRKKAHPKKAKLLSGFFKTGKGEYGEGDVFWGVTMPETRAVVKKFAGLSIGEVRKLIRSQVHEHRMAGLLYLVARYKTDPDATYKEYLSHLRHVNNWDLVDVTCHRIVGAHALEKGNISPLLHLARSKNMWERRIAIISTAAFLAKKNDKPTYRIVDILLHDEHDLIQKAVGWMLREAGKRVDEGRLRAYLDRHATTMPRTSLRYAIERFPKPVQKKYLRGDV